jgi:Rps23 Pro-64 3,4-dihydroxylase Tpa1-like proline 4-hydroxylase
MNRVFDYERWQARLPELAAAYRSAQPFPSIVLDAFLEEEALKAALAAFPGLDDPQWTHYVHVNEKKLAQTKRELIPAPALRVINELNSPRFLAFLSRLTGIEGLLADPSLEGGGLHQIRKGGFLNIHADFTAHPRQKHWARRVNVLVYMNEDWKDEYGGHLQLWSTDARRCVKKVLPVFNRCLIFSTDPNSFHGHPEPLTCPEGRSRKSMALYYFTLADKPFTRSTEYKPRPDDPASKKALIFLDKMALRAYDFAKRRLGLRNEWIGKLLRLFSK